MGMERSLFNSKNIREIIEKNKKFIANKI